MWSDEEIRRSYRTAKHPKQQISILTDLTLKSMEEIERICGVEKKDESVEAVLKILYGKMDALGEQIAQLEDEYKKIVTAIEVVGKLGA